MSPRSPEKTREIDRRLKHPRPRRHRYDAGHEPRLGRARASQAANVHRVGGFGGVGLIGGSSGNRRVQVGLFEGEAWDQGPYFGVVPTGYSPPADETRGDVCAIDPSRPQPGVRPTR